MPYYFKQALKNAQAFTSIALLLTMYKLYFLLMITNSVSMQVCLVGHLRTYKRFPIVSPEEEQQEQQQEQLQLTNAMRCSW